MSTLGRMARRVGWPLVVFAFDAALFVINFTGVGEPTVGGHQVSWPYLLAAGACVFVVLVGWTFYRYQSDLDERDKYEAALSVLESLQLQGTELLNEVGFDPTDMHGYTSPSGRGAGYLVWFGEVASPKILAFAAHIPQGARECKGIGQISGKAQQRGECVAGHGR